jgi:hypothetical protein
MNNNQDTNKKNIPVSITILNPYTIDTDCGLYTPATIKKLMHDLSNTPIPLTSCIYRLSARYINEKSIRMSVHSDGGTYDPTQHHNASFYIMHRTCHKCAANECAKNIATGKCHDEYVRKMLGATLFPKYYTQDKQK